MATYQIVEYPASADVGFQPYGGGAELWRCKDPEVMLSGPAETGKTRTCLEKLDALMWKYPGAQAAIVRKTRVSMTGSVLQTYENKVLGKETPISFYGGKQVQWYSYPNGSTVFVGGMDNPDKVLSSERDVIYVNQAEELLLDDWEKLTTRVTGRAGNMPYAQIFGDCNPGHPTHWIVQRRDSGRLKFLESRHEDNPTLFDPVTKQITEQGKRSLDLLNALTGVRYQRLRLGKWVAAEGVVYEDWDRARHLIEPFPIPAEWARYRSIDFGYANPFVCQWWARDPDGRIYLYRELYGTQRIVDDWAAQINLLSRGELFQWTVADHDAEDRATLRVAGIQTIPADKEVSPGIQSVAQRLRIGHDGKPRLFIFSNALHQRDVLLDEKRKPACTAEEFDSYVWTRSGDGRVVKEQPVKEDDHGMDALRYFVHKLDKRAPKGGTL